MEKTGGGLRATEPRTTESPTRRAPRPAPLPDLSQRGLGLGEPGHVNLSDEVPPFCGHRLAGFVSTVPVRDLVHLHVATGDRDHEGIADVRRRFCRDLVLEDCGIGRLDRKSVV